MRRCSRSLAVLFLFVPGLALHAGGYLWFGSEYQGEQHLYRYDIDAGTIDVDCEIPSTDHWNNVAVDETSVYIGHTGSDTFAIVDATPLSPTSCNVLVTTTHSSPLGGAKEDGAFHAGTGRLWRATYSGGLLHETLTDGTVVASYGGSPGGLVGLAWVGERLFATNWSSTQFGELTFDQTSVDWTQIPFTGTVPPSTYGALAYDREDDVLYMIAGANQLYSVAIDDVAGTAEATFVADLTALGYPAGGLIDGMGWIREPCTETPVGIVQSPAGAGLAPGDPLSLSVSASGTAPLTYRWRRGGVPLSDGGTVLGATTATLTIDPVATSDAGLYDCVVTNVCGDRTSDAALVSVGSAANVGGYLWLGAEFSGEGSYYRYDVAGNVIDRVCPRTLPSGAEHWNHMATDGVHLYLGTPNTQDLHRVSGGNCDAVAEFAHAPALAGRLEDGAYRASSDTLWRVSYTGQLHETSKDGAALQSYATQSGLVGLAWQGETLYATSYANGTIGELTLAAPNATYTVIPWSGSPPTGTMGALAADPGGEALFLVTRAGLLYSVSFAGGQAIATPIVDLNDVGFPAGALADGLGWIGACAAGASPDVAFATDGVTLDWADVPGSTYDVISGEFVVDATANAWSGAGGLLATATCRANDLGSSGFDTSGVPDPAPGTGVYWLVRVCAGSWNSSGSIDRDAEVLCP